MADPLSVTASIAGVVVLAAQLYSVVTNFISDVNDAPSFAQAISAELYAFGCALEAIQELLASPSFEHNRRRKLVSAECIIVSCTDAVLLFSQLEATVLPLASISTHSLGKKTLPIKTQWALKKSKLSELISRLQWQKNTLTLQLTILKWYVYLHSTPTLGCQTSYKAGMLRRTCC